MPDKLKPCPFCGGEAKLVYTSGNEPRPMVTCNDCEAVMHSKVIVKQTGSEVIAAWNKRVTEEEKL